MRPLNEVKLKRKMAIGTGRRLGRCAFGAPPGARRGECGATEARGAVLIPQKATRGPRYLCHTHHNANRPRPDHFVIPATAAEPEAPEETDEGRLEYIETDKWDASAAKLEATLEATRMLENERRFALLAKKDVVAT